MTEKTECLSTTFRSDRTVFMTILYHHARYARKLSKEEVKEIFDFVFNNTQIFEHQ